MTRGPQKRFRREDVLEQAMELFWKQGYQATGMAELLRHVGIGRQSLYDTFGDKRSLYLETLRHYFSSRIGPVLAQLRSDEPPLDNVRKVFELWMEMARRSDFCGCMIGNSIADVGRRDPEVNALVEGYFQTVERAFEENLERARRTGELNPAVAPADMARLLLNTAQGLALLSRATPDLDRVQSVVRTTLSLLEAR